MTITYRNLVTGQPAQEVPAVHDYFSLQIKAQAHGGYRYGTSQGENLCAYDTTNTFGNAWVDALTHTVVGGKAYAHLREMQEQPRDIDPGTEPDSPVYQGQDDEALTQKWAEQEGGFDPYAGNLDTLLGY